jgi:hypothetical protein
MVAIQDRFSRRFSDGGDNPAKDLRSYTYGPSEANAVVERFNALSEEGKQAILNFLRSLWRKYGLLVKPLGDKK